MSTIELEKFVSSLSESERHALRDILGAAEEGVSVQEFRAMTAALDEELNDPSPALSATEVFAELRSLYPSDNGGSKA